jgi:hypothetical protein
LLQRSFDSTGEISNGQYGWPCFHAEKYIYI